METIFPAHQRFSNSCNIAHKAVGQLFTEKLQQNPDKTFLICPGKYEEIFSYKTFNSHYLGAARYLIHLGLKKGDRFNLIFSNSSEFLLFYFAGLVLGVTVVPINPDLSSDEMRYIVDDCKSKAIIYDQALSAKIDNIFVGGSNLVVLKAIDSIHDCTYRQTENISSDLSLPEIGLSDEAVIIYTSGTTGNPKGVVLSNLNLLADAKAIAEWFQFSTETRALCILPLFHNNGQITTLLAPLYAGGSTVIVKGKASLLSFWTLVDHYSATFTSVMASILSILLSLSIERKDKTLIAILCGGQVLSKSVQEMFEDRFDVPIFEGYGLTETTSFSCINDFPKQNRVSGSIGKALPVNEMAIFDDEDNELGPNIEGQICIRGLNVACEYLGLSERNVKSFANGWFHSGDYGLKDNEGYFYFRGRKDFLIIKGGENIYPAELENVLYKHLAVAECAVIGVPDKLLGEEICAFVKLRENMTASVTELKNFCRGKIAGYKQAKIIIIINELGDMNEIPKGPTKKILYRVLKSYYLENMDKLTQKSKTLHRKDE